MDCAGHTSFQYPHGAGAGSPTIFVRREHIEHAGPIGKVAQMKEAIGPIEMAAAALRRDTHHFDGQAGDCTRFNGQRRMNRGTTQWTSGALPRLPRLIEVMLETRGMERMATWSGHAWTEPSQADWALVFAVRSHHREPRLKSGRKPLSLRAEERYGR